MATRYTDEFRRDAVRIATTSGLTRPQAASDLGVGLSTLNKTVPGWGPPVRGRNSLCYRCDMKGSGRSLIGG